MFFNFSPYKHEENRGHTIRYDTINKLLYIANNPFTQNDTDEWQKEYNYIKKKKREKKNTSTMYGIREKNSDAYVIKNQKYKYVSYPVPDRFLLMDKQI